MTKTLCITILMSLSSLTHAAKWFEIDRTSDELIEMDLESIQNVGTTTAPIAKAWTKLTSFTDAYGAKLGAGDYALGLQQYDCSNHRMQYLAYTSYDKQGRVKDSKKNEYLVYEEIIPDSVGELMLKVACTAVHQQKKNAKVKTL